MHMYYLVTHSICVLRTPLEYFTLTTGDSINVQENHPEDTHEPKQGAFNVRSQTKPLEVEHG